MFIEKRTALGKSLGMGVDRIDIFHFRPRQSQQVVLDFYQFFTDDGAAAAPDKVIDFRNSPGGGVFNGDNAVINHSSRNGFRHIFKEGEIYFFPLPLAEVPFHGLIGIGAFRAVTADADPFSIVSPISIFSISQADLFPFSPPALDALQCGPPVFPFLPAASALLSIQKGRAV